MRGRIAFFPIAALFLVASSLRLFRDEHPSNGSREVVTETFVDLAGGAQTYPSGTPARVASPDRFEEANRPPASEARCSGPARRECDSWLFVVARKSPCSLRRLPLAAVGFLNVAFDMPCN